MRNIYLFYLCLLLSAATANAQSQQKGKDYYEYFSILVNDNSTKDKAYDYLYKAYMEYAGCDNLDLTPNERKEIKIDLTDMHPYLRMAAYHYAAKNDQQQVLKYARAYTDLPELKNVSDNSLTEDKEYALLAFLAATNLFNKKDYTHAVGYFQSYLSTNDQTNREHAFEGLIRTYYLLRNYENAVYIGTQGLKLYPNNWILLRIGIESCRYIQDDERMQTFLTKALELRPDNEDLIICQAKLYERTGKYEEAARCFYPLYEAQQNSMNYACHLGFNYYNAAVELARTDLKEARREGSSAHNYFKKAVPLLEDILLNSPYASNVAYALTTCYVNLNDATNSERLNKILASLSGSTVNVNSHLVLEEDYKPMINVQQAKNHYAYANEMGVSDVDMDIPISSAKNNDTYVVIVGNENYKYFSRVNYAHNDGKTFAQYCHKVFGIPKEHIRERYDATLSEIKEPIKFLMEKTAMNPGRLNIIFYYAGHGIPNVNSGEAYLLPTDATGTDFEFCYQLNELYDQLNSLQAKSVTLFLDACFSGATRGNEMLFSERFVEYETKSISNHGSVIAFCATSGKQTAMAYDAMHHGFFTYFLLKKIKETAGNVNLGELSTYIKEMVTNRTLDLKNKKQTPTVNVSVQIGESWKERPLLPR